jgi:hypothetical protein
VAEGGISRVTNYYQEEKTVLARRQSFAQGATPARAIDEVLAGVRRAV